MAERTYRIGAVAAKTGLTEERIRSWERRYSVLAPRRTLAGYRVYSDADVAVLAELARLTREGISIAEAAKLVVARRPERALGESAFVELREVILAAAMRWDQGAVERALDEALAGDAPLAVFDRLIVPVQTEVGGRWLDGRISVGQEHLVTQAVRERVVALLREAPRGAGPHVIAACFPEEEHEVGLLGVALRLRLAGARVTYLGARTPARQLAEAARVVRPFAVALAAVHDRGEATFEKELREALKSLPHGTRLILGGAAAEAHAPVARKRGALVLSSEELVAQVRPLAPVLPKG